MLFNSIDFLFFFPVVLVLGNLLKGKSQRLLLLFASFYFYMAWNKNFIFLILASTFLDYFVALYLDSIPLEKKFGLNDLRHKESHSQPIP